MEGERSSSSLASGSSVVTSGTAHPAPLASKSSETLPAWKPKEEDDDDGPILCRNTLGRVSLPKKKHHVRHIEDRAAGRDAISGFDSPAGVDYIPIGGKVMLLNGEDLLSTVFPEEAPALMRGAQGDSKQSEGVFLGRRQKFGFNQTVDHSIRIWKWAYFELDMSQGKPLENMPYTQAHVMVDVEVGELEMYLSMTENNEYPSEEKYDWCVPAPELDHEGKPLPQPDVHLITILPIDLEYLRSKGRKLSISIRGRTGPITFTMRAFTASYTTGIRTLLRERQSIAGHQAELLRRQKKAMRQSIMQSSVRKQRAKVGLEPPPVGSRPLTEGPVQPPAHILSLRPKSVEEAFAQLDSLEPVVQESLPQRLQRLESLVRTEPEPSATANSSPQLASRGLPGGLEASFVNWESTKKMSKAESFKIGFRSSAIKGERDDEYDDEYDNDDDGGGLRQVMQQDEDRLIRSLYNHYKEEKKLPQSFSANPPKDAAALSSCAAQYGLAPTGEVNCMVTGVNVPNMQLMMKDLKIMSGTLAKITKRDINHICRDAFRKRGSTARPSDDNILLNFKELKAVCKIVIAHIKLPLYEAGQRPYFVDEKLWQRLVEDNKPERRLAKLSNIPDFNKKVVKAFGAYDSNSDGFLTRDEFFSLCYHEVGINREDATAILQQHNCNERRGLLDVETFAKVFNLTHPHIPNESESAAAKHKSLTQFYRRHLALESSCTVPAGDVVASKQHITSYQEKALKMTGSKATPLPLAKTLVKSGWLYRQDHTERHDPWVLWFCVLRRQTGGGVLELFTEQIDPRQEEHPPKPAVSLLLDGTAPAEAREEDTHAQVYAKTQPPNLTKYHPKTEKNSGLDQMISELKIATKAGRFGKNLLALSRERRSHQTQKKGQGSRPGSSTSESFDSRTFDSRTQSSFQMGRSQSSFSRKQSDETSAGSSFRAGKVSNAMRRYSTPAHNHVTQHPFRPATPQSPSTRKTPQRPKPGPKRISSTGVLPAAGLSPDDAAKWGGWQLIRVRCMNGTVEVFKVRGPTAGKVSRDWVQAMRSSVFQEELESHESMQQYDMLRHSAVKGLCAILNEVEMEANAEMDSSLNSAAQGDGEASQLRDEGDAMDTLLEDLELGNTLGDELSRALVQGEREESVLLEGERESVRFEDEDASVEAADESSEVVQDGGSRVKSLRTKSVEKLMGLLKPEAMVAPYLGRDGLVNLERPPLNPYSSPEDWDLLTKAGLMKPRAAANSKTKGRNRMNAY